MSASGSDQNPRIPNVVLTGFSGSGKSTVGRFIARELGFGFVDTDFAIEDRWGPIPDIFADYSEDRFRVLERIIVCELADLPKLVIATGGGTVLDPRDVTNLERRGLIVCLTATPRVILERILLCPGSRPLLSGPDAETKIASLLAERSGAYGVFPQVDTSGKGLPAVADEVVSLVRDAATPP